MKIKTVLCHCSALLAGLMILPGCSICPPGYLDDYAAVGGKWQRADPARGRVGSILSDPGSTVQGETVVDNGYYGSEYGMPGYDEGYYGVPGGAGEQAGYGNSGIYVPTEDYSTAPGYGEELMPADSYDSSSSADSYGGSSILEGSY